MLALWFGLWVIVASVFASPVERGNNCRDFNFTVFSGVSNSSQYNIVGSYCSPHINIPHRSQSIQILLHGGTFNKQYWSALGPVGAGYHKQKYSWVEYFRNQGFHTLALDRLGSGNSSHPHSELVSAESQANITAEIVKKVKRGSKELPKFNKVILVGHSYGSLILDVLAQYGNPGTDVLIYTSYSRYIPNLAGTSSGQVTAPARSIFPDRFGTLDEGYVTLVNASVIRNSFYGADGTFDPKFPAVEFAVEDAQPVGELNSIAKLFTGSFPNITADRYRGLLLWVVGQNDNVFCGGQCGYGDDNIIRQNARYYPNVKELGFISGEETGHMLNLHYKARETFDKVEEWLFKHSI